MTNLYGEGGGSSRGFRGGGDGGVFRSGGDDAVTHLSVQPALTLILVFLKEPSHLNGLVSSLKAACYTHFFFKHVSQRNSWLVQTTDYFPTSLHTEVFYSSYTNLSMKTRPSGGAVAIETVWPISESRPWCRFRWWLHTGWEWSCSVLGSASWQPVWCWWPTSPWWCNTPSCNERRDVGKCW